MSDYKDDDEQFFLRPSSKQIRMCRFWRKYTRLMRAGIPLLRTLEVMVEEENEPGFQLVIKSLRELMIHGATLSEAMERHPSVFSLSILEMIRIAEKRGAWDEVLQEITDGLLEGTFE